MFEHPVYCGNYLALVQQSNYTRLQLLYTQIKKYH
jgi:hypothetical protein